MKLVWAVNAAIFALILTLSPVNAQNCESRVRKDWEALTTTEKATYKDALAAAMDSGAYIKFVEIHTEMQSLMEAHHQCMFIYWHRLLLVAFENMLRGQGARFACVTVPYYNWVSANTRSLAGSCSSIGDCSSIMTELGGYTTGRQLTININGVNNSGRCVRQSPLDHFCQSGTISGAACARCVPRGNWGSTRLPGSTSFASIRQQLFSAQNIGQMSPAIEQGCHNNMHASLSGTMGYFTAPADPIFWSHHATVDALHTIFHKCRVGTQRMTFEQKASHPVAWTSCSRQNGGNFNPTDAIVMRTGVNGNNPIPANQDPIIGRYFTGVPNQYAGLMDVRDLGDSSYSYELSGQLADLYNNCDGMSPPSPPAAAPTPAPSSAPVPAPPETPRPDPPVAPVPAPFPPNDAPAPEPQQPIRWSLFDWLRNRWRSRWNNNRRLTAEPSPLPKSSACYDQTNVPAPVPTTPQTNPQYDGNKNNNVDVIIVDKKKCAEEVKVSTWYDQSVTAMGGHGPEVIADLERQVCMFENQCLGGTPDYSDEFKATWGAKEPRCLTLVKAIQSGQQQISFGLWRQNMESHFGCPKPANTTQRIDQTGAYDSATQSTNLTGAYDSVTQSTDQTGAYDSVAQSTDQTGAYDSLTQSTDQTDSATQSTDLTGAYDSVIQSTDQTGVYDSVDQIFNLPI